jgi:hypothetical protein
MKKQKIEKNVQDFFWVSFSLIKTRQEREITRARTQWNEIFKENLSCMYVSQGKRDNQLIDKSQSHQGRKLWV